MMDRPLSGIANQAWPLTRHRPVLKPRPVSPMAQPRRLPRSSLV